MDTRPWSTHHPCCVVCGTTERPHVGLGRCTRCYNRYNYQEHVEKQRARAAELTRAWQQRHPERKMQNDRAFYTRNKERIATQRHERKHQAAAGRAEGDIGD
jgi:predicted ATP-dependent serine protease